MKIGDLFVDRLALTHLAGNLLDSVNHGGVIAPAEEPGDARITQIGHLTEHVHGDLAGGHQWSLTTFALERLDFKTENPGDFLQQFGIGSWPWRTVGQ